MVNYKALVYNVWEKFSNLKCFLYFIKTKNVHSEKVLREYTNKSQTEQQYLQIMCLIKDLYPEHIKNIQNLVIRKRTTQENNWAKDLSRSFHKYDIHEW